MLETLLHNSLTKVRERFVTQEPGVVRMYSCGPTVYDFAHIGNFRSFLFADVLRRYLEGIGYDVWHVMNITDVGHMTDDADADGGGDDKMQVAARRLKESKKSGAVDAGAVRNPDDPYQVAEYYLQAFLEDGRQLGLKVAGEYPGRVPRATAYIPEMQALIVRLIERGHAYVGRDGVVYYSVESFPRYGALSGNTIERLKEGAGGRIDTVHQRSKRHPADFMLWKPDPSHIMKWDSPWGAGYPGWHIECSTMAMRVLERDVIDIHTGGEDLIFPHHECEIAQSCGATGAEYFARFWMHARFLLVEGQKMSKRQGNFFTVRDVLSGRATGGQPVHAATLRYELIKTHYRANLNFTIKGLSDSARAVRRLSERADAWREQSGGVVTAVDGTHPVVAEFFAALADDLNMSAALAAVHLWLEQPGADPAESLGVLARLDGVLGICELLRAQPVGDAGDVERVCMAIDAARLARDFHAADRMRAELDRRGYEVRSSREKTVARRKLA
jgi:cysteinyl-tRNA synthetase